MKTFLPILLIMVLLSQAIFAQDNELHAVMLRHEGVFPEKDFLDNPLFTDLNISGDISPQNEPSVRISRSNPDVVVAAWRDFRLGWQEPNVIRRIGYAYSHDGGLTWSESQLLPDPNPNHLSQSDPVLTSDSEGNFYLSSTSRQPVANYNREMLIYKSTDNGQTFNYYSTAVPGSGLQGEDKEWIFCDPVPGNPTYDNVMIAWRSFGPSPGIKFRKSDVGGTNWSPTVDVSDGYYGQGANLATGTDGSIYVVWLDNGIKFDRSTDGGASFGMDRFINSYYPQTNKAFPYICVDYSQTSGRGNVYVVWSDGRNGSDDVWFQRSEDSGNTWLDQPVRVNDISLNQQYWPVVQCDENGRLVVVFYDEREGLIDINAYMAYSDDHGDSWTNIKLSNETFMANTPNTNVRYGDYIGIDAWGGNIVPVWTDDRAGSYDQEIYTALVDIPVKLPEYKVENEAFVLYQNYPNPYRDQTTIHFDLLVPMHVKAEIYNTAGQLLDIPLDAVLQAGKQQLKWQRSSAKAGIYYLKLYSGNAVSYLKMTQL